MNPPDPVLIEDEEVWNPKYPVRKYEKQEKCGHPNFKLLLKCTCTLTLGDNDLDKVVEILLREQTRRAKVKEYTL